MRHFVSVSFLVVATMVVPVETHAMDELTSCGQFVRGSAVLVADLDCSATDDDAVKLQGRLHLAGFTIIGHPAHDVVSCEKGPCRIAGPGTLTGGAGGVRSKKNARLVDVTVGYNAGRGVYARKSARLDGGMLAGNAGTGVYADKIQAFATQISGNGGDGAHAIRKASLFDCSVTGNAGDGVSSDRLARVSHYTVVSGNGLDGIDAGRIMVKRYAAVTMNGASLACGVTEPCDDLATDRRPVVSLDAVCGTSRDTRDGGSWDACSDD